MRNLRKPFLRPDPTGPDCWCLYSPSHYRIYPLYLCNKMPPVLQRSVPSSTCLFFCLRAQFSNLHRDLCVGLCSCPRDKSMPRRTPRLLSENSSGRLMQTVSITVWQVLIELFMEQTRVGQNSSSFVYYAYPLFHNKLYFNRTTYCILIEFINIWCLMKWKIEVHISTWSCSGPAKITISILARVICPKPFPSFSPSFLSLYTH